MPTAGSNRFRLILVLTSLGGYCNGQAPGAVSSNLVWQPGWEMRRVTVDLSALSRMTTLIGFHHTNPPPWPRGNSLTLSTKTNVESGLPEGGWNLANMHAENYDEIIKLRHFKTLEFGLMPDHRCFVVDPRVPREWLLDEPGGELAQRLSLRTRFPNLFRKNPVADSIVGTKWVLVNREDPGGLSESVLPGEKLRFGVTDLTCEAASRIQRGARLWEMRDPAVALFVYELLPEGGYTGASFRFTREGDELVLVATGKLFGSTTNGYGGRHYEFPAKATYRREP